MNFHRHHFCDPFFLLFISRIGFEMLSSCLLPSQNGKAKFLICTDVAARGIDIKGVPYGGSFRNSQQYASFSIQSELPSVEIYVFNH